MNFKKLSLLVEKSNLGKARIANRCGISRTTLDNVLSGADAKISTIEKIAEVLGVSVTEFYDDEVQAEPKPKKRRGCGDALLSAVEGLAGGSGREELQSQIDHLSAELADARQIIDTLQRQLHLNSNYITLLEKQLSDTTNNQKGDNAATA